MRVEWTHLALQHLEEIYEYIRRDSEQYALQMIDRITNRTKQLKRFPLSGPLSDFSNVREIVEGNYRVMYRVEENAVVMLAVFHSARLIPPDTFQSE